MISVSNFALPFDRNERVFGFSNCSGIRFYLMKKKNSIGKEMLFENYVGGMAIGIRSQTHGIVLVISESRSRCYRILRSSAMHNFWVIFVIDIVEKPTSSVVSRSMNFL